MGVQRYLQAHGVRFLNVLSDQANWQQAVKGRKAVTKYLAFQILPPLLMVYKEGAFQFCNLLSNGLDYCALVCL